MVFPVSTSPVSETRRTSGCVTSRSPAGTPSPVTTFSTPGGQHAGGELGEAKQRERRLLGRLQHLRVPGGERGRELPDGHHQRVVPRRDPGDDPERLAADHRGVAAHVLARALALEQPRRAGEEAQVVDADRDLVARVGERLADVRRLDPGELLGVVLEHLARARAAPPRARPASCRASPAAPPSPRRPRRRRRRRRTAEPPRAPPRSPGSAPPWSRRRQPAPSCLRRESLGRGHSRDSSRRPPCPSCGRGRCRGSGTSPPS